MTSACKHWLGEARKTHSCQFQQLVSDRQAANLSSLAGGNQCRNLFMYGAFHGHSGMTADPFRYSAIAATTFQARSVCYDGATCLVFDNVEDLKSCASDLKRTPNCRYEITGNQNIGLLTSVPLLCKPRELVDTTSKVTVFVDGASIKLQYAPCTRAGTKCGYARKDDHWGRSQSKNDPNAKWCESDAVIVEQRCCPKSQKPDEEWGKWSVPGEACT